MFTKKFWTATAERVIRSFAASAASLVVVGSNVFNLDWQEVAGVSLGSAVVTLLLCLAGGAFGPGDGPALLGKEELAEPVNQP